MQIKLEIVEIVMHLENELLVLEISQKSSLVQRHQLDIWNKSKGSQKIGWHENSSKQTFYTVGDVLSSTLDDLRVSLLFGVRWTPIFGLWIFRPHVLIESKISSDLNQKQISDEGIFQSSNFVFSCF